MAFIPGGAEELAVKALYSELKMDEVFREAEERAFTDIRAEVDKIEADGDLCLSSDIFKLLANKIYRRQK